MSSNSIEDLKREVRMSLENWKNLEDFLKEHEDLIASGIDLFDKLHGLFVALYDKWPEFDKEEGELVSMNEDTDGPAETIVCNCCQNEVDANDSGRCSQCHLVSCDECLIGAWPTHFCKDCDKEYSKNDNGSTS